MARRCLQRISPEGAGNVTIRFDYTVNQSDIVDGKLIKHPYTVASGLVLNDDNFSDHNGIEW